MDTTTRPCPHIPGFAIPMMKGMECPELATDKDPEGSAGAKARFCRAEARQAGLIVPEPGERPMQRYRK